MSPMRSKRVTRCLNKSRKFALLYISIYSIRNENETIPYCDIEANFLPIEIVWIWLQTINNLLSVLVTLFGDGYFNEDSYLII